MENMQQRLKEMKYNKQGRFSLLILCVLSLVNIAFVFISSGNFFPLSVYSVSRISHLAWVHSFQAGTLILYLALALVVSGIYFLFWFFSKKSHIFMYGALVFYSIDTILLIVDLATYGELVYIWDLAFHAIMLFYLVIGSLQGLQVWKGAKATATAESSENTQVDSAEAARPSAYSYLSNASRYIKIERKKSLIGGMRTIVIYIDGEECAQVKNGESIEIKVSGSAHDMVALIPSSGASATRKVQEGPNSKSYTIKAKASVTEGFVEIFEVV